MCCIEVFFFFQAEDGIRDLVRSRGLGDVYKRQVMRIFPVEDGKWRMRAHLDEIDPDFIEALLAYEAVSYTHLTLPTSDLV